MSIDPAVVMGDRILKRLSYYYRIAVARSIRCPQHLGRSLREKTHKDGIDSIVLTILLHLGSHNFSVKTQLEDLYTSFIY